jgi:hypothetical protein
MKHALFTSFILAVCAVTAAEEKRPDTALAMFGSAENVAIVERADSIAACMLRYTPPPGKVFGPGEKYEETVFVQVEKGAADRIRETLLSDATYRWDVVTGCWPQYGVRLRFQKSDRTVTVDFCLRCKVLLVARDKKPLGGGLFYHAAHVFTEEFGKLFPKEKLR